jgi:hypothetical protein
LVRTSGNEDARTECRSSIDPMIKEHECAVLTEELTAKGLKAGDLGTVVHVHEAGAGYEVEFMTLAGQTVTVVTLAASQLRAITSRDIAHVREIP